MVEQINQPVSVLYLHNKNKRTMLPVRITWNNRMYTISKVGFHYKTVKSGDVKHFFYVTAGEIYFKISLDTKTLETVLEEAGDGLPS